MKPMGNRNNIEDVEVHVFELDIDDRFVSLYAGFQGDLVKFLKLTSLKSRVVSIGNDVYSYGLEFQDCMLTASENIVSIRCCFRKNFEGLKDYEFAVMKKSKVIFNHSR